MKRVLAVLGMACFLASGPGALETAASQEQIYIKEPHEEGKVTLSFAGDISFAEGYANMGYYHAKGDDITKCIEGDVIARMDGADVMMVNNEFTYSDRGKPLSGKTFTFRAKPETAANLQVLSADIVSLANNHVYDYGETALLDTLDTLEQYKIPYVGAGRNREEAEKIVYFQVGDRKIAYVSATQVERSYVYTKEATDTRAGVLRTYDPARFVEVIKRAEEARDFASTGEPKGSAGLRRTSRVWAISILTPGRIWSSGTIPTVSRG